VVGDAVDVVAGRGVCCRLWRWAQPRCIAIEVFSLRRGVGARSGCGLRSGSGSGRGGGRGSWWLFGFVGGFFCDGNDESKINVSDIVSPVLGSVSMGRQWVVVVLRTLPRACGLACAPVLVGVSNSDLQEVG
jgi:hypothetical protein